ncbi:MAG: hypothetical protein HPY83_01585 [Anaerolineae bacterium]|nr:hypothetical protein [Anaerolineae bacterium]
MSSYRPEEGSIRRFILRQVMQNIRCGACGARYRHEDVAIVENNDNVWMLMAVCPGCDTQAMVMVVVQESVQEPHALPCLSEDDVLDFHSLLLDFTGDMRSLFDESV